MKIPKKIRMFGFDWKIVIDKKEQGGNYSWETKTIKLGSMFGEQERIFFHEILEAILVDNLCRYYTNENSSEFQFIFSHSKFVIVAKQFYDILKDNKLI